MLSGNPRVRTRPFLLLSPLLCVMALAGCAKPPAQATLAVPPILREKCDRARVGDLKTVGDLGALTVRQEAAVASCDNKRAALVSLVDAYGEITKPKRWRLPWSRP